MSSDWNKGRRGLETEIMHCFFLNKTDKKVEDSFLLVNTIAGLISFKLLIPKFFRVCLYINVTWDMKAW